MWPDAACTVWPRGERNKKGRGGNLLLVVARRTLNSCGGGGCGGVVQAREGGALGVVEETWRGPEVCLCHMTYEGRAGQGGMGRDRQQGCPLGECAEWRGAGCRGGGWMVEGWGVAGRRAVLITAVGRD
ncbi:hypothetical protein E2C01_084463 [Portunus trituberculatus]|uniref:Uncharacterized protein n=1 Tax=Portunus trituberculatus TaxID=210409 RepID=A0A5B7J022_PORTR|nr:hypothetical protein [Portunus trituberculatus]